MSFFAHCRADIFQDWEPQHIVLTAPVRERLALTPKGVERARARLDGQVGEVDWDVRESCHPVVITTTYPHWTGRAQRVETTSEDDVFYARVDRGRRPIWGRFARGRKGLMSRSQTVVLRPVDVIDEDGQHVGWEVVAAYADVPAPPFPGDRFAGRDSLAYWRTHALVDGALPYDEGSVTTECPW